MSKFFGQSSSSESDTESENENVVETITKKTQNK